MLLFEHDLSAEVIGLHFIEAGIDFTEPGIDFAETGVHFLSLASSSATFTALVNHLTEVVPAEKNWYLRCH